MGETIGLILILLLSLYGCAQLILALSRRLLLPAKGDRGMVIIPLSGHRTDIEYLVRSISFRQCQNRHDIPIYLVDTGLDEESRALAFNICGKLGQKLYTAEDLEKVWGVGLQQQQIGL